MYEIIFSNVEGSSCPHCYQSYISTYNELDGGYRTPAICANCGKRMDVSKIIKAFNTWGVTVYGIECFYEYYPIAKDTLDGRIYCNWVGHISEKPWVDKNSLSDFIKAYEYALEFFRKPIKIDMSYEKYLETEHWKQARKKAREYYGNNCVLCGAEENLHVHHRNYDYLTAEIIKKDLSLLCRDCHAFIHNKD